jgi:hypothetical protein
MRMSTRWLALVLVSTVVGAALTGCGPKLSPAAKDALLGRYDPYIDQPQIISAKRVEPLESDITVGALEVWCVNMTVRCISPYYWTQDLYTTCGDSRLVRLIGDEWHVSVLVTEEDEQDWEARGCDLMPVIAAPPNPRAPW